MKKSSIPKTAKTSQTAQTANASRNLHSPNSSNHQSAPTPQNHRSAHHRSTSPFSATEELLKQSTSTRIRKLPEPYSPPALPNYIRASEPLLRQTIGKKRPVTGQLSLFEDLTNKNQDLAVAATQNNITEVGANLSVAERTALHSLQKLFSHRDYQNPIVFPITEYLDAYGVSKKKSSRGFYEYNSKARGDALKALQTLVKPILFYWKQLKDKKYWKKNKSGKLEKTYQVVTTVEPILRIQWLFDNVTEGELQEIIGSGYGSEDWDGSMGAIGGGRGDGGGDGRGGRDAIGGRGGGRGGGGSEAGGRNGRDGSGERNGAAGVVGSGSGNLRNGAGGSGGDGGSGRAKNKSNFAHKKLTHLRVNAGEFFLSKNFVPMPDHIFQTIRLKYKKPSRHFLTFITLLSLQAKYKNFHPTFRQQTLIDNLHLRYLEQSRQKKRILKMLTEDFQRAKEIGVLLDWKEELTAVDLQYHFVINSKVFWSGGKLGGKQGKPGDKSSDKLGAKQET